MTGFLYDDGKLIAEYDDAGFVTEEYIHGLGLGHDVGSLICKETSESTAYYFYNYRGDVVDIVNDAGSIQNSYRYDAFGKLIDSSAPQIGFSSKRYDASTALSYFGARYYDSTTARFVSRDPKKYVDGPNMYIMAKNNPLLWIDPWGLNVRQSKGWTLQIGGSGTAGFAGGQTIGSGIVLGYSEEKGFQFGAYLNAGLGPFIGKSASATIDISWSKNKDINDLEGITMTTGGSAAYIYAGGYEINIPINKKHDNTVSHTFSFGGGLGIETHTFGSHTKVFKFIGKD